MAISRYKNVQIVRNVDDNYKTVFSSRFPYNGIKQYALETLRNPTIDEKASMDTDTYTWKYGSKLYKLSHQYYGSSSYWWVIAWFNKIANENQLNFGDTILIPTSLDSVLTTYGL